MGFYLGNLKLFRVELYVCIVRLGMDGCIYALMYVCIYVPRNSIKQ